MSCSAYIYIYIYTRASLSNSLLKHSRKVIPGFFAQLLLAHCLQMDSST